MKITLIGGGNIGSAIACGLASGTHFKPENITVIDINPDALKRINAIYPEIITIQGDDYAAVSSADIVVIAVKPWLVKNVAEKLRVHMDYTRQILLSVAAGISFEQLASFFSKEGKIPSLFRMIPNTAIALKASVNLISAYTNTVDWQQKQMLDIFNELGKAMLIDEAKLPAATALTSCGIAFAFKYIRAAMSGGIEMGLYPEEAKEMVAQTVLGAALILQQKGTHPETEIDKVTTPGGITIKGINEMDAAGFTNAVIRGLKASNIQ